MSVPITITLSSVFDADGDDHLCRRRRRQGFNAVVDGRLVVRSSTVPLRDCCRQLLRDGLDPSTVVILRHDGDQSGSELRTTLRAGAELSPMGKVA